MDERKTANYFDIVDLVDKILPSKSKFNYLMMSPMGLVKRFDNEIESSGFYFEKETLLKIRAFIETRQKMLFNQESMNISSKKSNAQDFDQYNYAIQDNISHMKNAIIKSLTHDKRLMIPNYRYTTVNPSLKIGTLKEIYNQATHEKVQSYITDLLTITCESNDLLKIDASELADDILLHFGISPNESLTDKFQLKHQLMDVIHTLLKDSEIIHENIMGPFYRATTDMDRYNMELKGTVNILTGLVHQEIQRILLSTADYEGKKEEYDYIINMYNSDSSTMQTTTLTDDSSSETYVTDLTNNEHDNSQELIGTLQAKSEWLTNLRNQRDKLEKEYLMLLSKASELRCQLRELDDEIQRNL